MIVEIAIYADSCKVERRDPRSITGTREHCRRKSGLAWVHLRKPTEPELNSVKEEFNLSEPEVDDAIIARQRPKVERLDETVVVLLKPPRYVNDRCSDDPREVKFDEIQMFVGPDFVVSVDHSEDPESDLLHKQMEDNKRYGDPLAILQAILELVVTESSRVVEELEQDVDKVQNKMFANRPDGSHQMAHSIYKLSREVIAFHETPTTGRFASAPG